ncbi:hypothetical protein STEG23_033455 [Scotinomys teguina]
MCRLSWFLDPGGWSKATAVGQYFIFPGSCTLSLRNTHTEIDPLDKLYRAPEDCLLQALRPWDTSDTYFECGLPCIVIMVPEP